MSAKKIMLIQKHGPLRLVREAPGGWRFVLAGGFPVALWVVSAPVPRAPPASHHRLNETWRH